MGPSGPILCYNQAMYYVYILLCRDKTLYTGITTDPERRLRMHQQGTGAKYTRVHGALEMVYLEEAEDRSAASKREAAIKKLSREEKLRLIGGVSPDK